MFFLVAGWKGKRMVKVSDQIRLLNLLGWGIILMSWHFVVLANGECGD